jgi:prepilin-type N-terminal cleavage/methylation domain-containing protein
MSSRSRTGFTLVELLVALVIFTLVAGSLYRVMNVSQRTSRTQTEKAAMQGGLRTGVQLAMAELQELWTDQARNESAITTMTGTSLTFRAMRGLGVTCVDMAGLTTITIRDDATWTGYEDPEVGQGIYLFSQGANENSEVDDVWREAFISNVAAGTCTGGGAAFVLTVTGLTTAANVMMPAPVRTHEPMQIGLVADGGRNWLGVGTGGALSPVAGPLTSTGLEFKYYDAAGAETTTTQNVKSIVLRLFGETERAGNRTFSGTTTTLQDSMIVRVQLRNGL